MEIKPPPGFTIDSSTNTAPSIKPPPGFTLDGIKDGVKRTEPLTLLESIELATRVAPLPPERLQQGLDYAGEKVAEAGGRAGFPKTGAAVGTVVSELPAFYGAGASLAGLYSKTPTVLAKAIRKTPRMLSPEFEAGKKAAGISQDLPIRSGMAPRFKEADTLIKGVQSANAPARYPKDVNAFLNFARARIKALGNKLSPQELNDYKEIIGELFQGKIKPGTDAYAVATKLQREVTPLLNKVIPGREELNRVYALSKKLRVAPEIAEQLWKYFGPKLRWGAGVVSKQ